MKIDKIFSIKFDNDDFGYLDAFGLESEHIFSPFKGLELPDVPPMITHIIGESGSGKSQLSKILSEKWNLDIPECPADDAICCEFIGHTKDSIDKMIYYLNYVGLSDARLYYTEYKYLSDSQKFRAVLAYNFATNDSNGYIFDEFLSTLDRETAKSIAFLIQKLVRKENIKVVLTTAHNDLIEYLSPDLLIKGYAFPERFKVIKYGGKLHKIDYHIEYSSKENYRECRLGEIHYKAKYTGGSKEHFVAKTFYGDNIGWLVTAAVGKDIEKKRRIARVVVHPSYRGIGIGTELVKHYIKWAKDNGIKKVFAVSALGKFNPFFDKAEMDKCDDYIVKPKPAFIKELIDNKFNVDKWFSKEYCIEVCNDLALRKVIVKHSTNINRIINPGGKKMTIKESKDMILADSGQSGRYLWTLRPRILAKYKKDL